jgi:hypothetical protein
VDAREEFDRTPLMLAAGAGSVETVKELVARSMDVEAPGIFG